VYGPPGTDQVYIASHREVLSLVTAMHLYTLRNTHAVILLYSLIGKIPQSYYENPLFIDLKIQCSHVTLTFDFPVKPRMSDTWDVDAIFNVFMICHSRLNRPGQDGTFLNRAIYKEGHITIA